MTLNILRGLFVLLMAAVGYTFVVAEPSASWPDFLVYNKWLGMAVSLVLGVIMICVDIIAGRRKLAVFSGIAFGLLVGMVITYGLSFAVALAVDNLLLPNTIGQPGNVAIIGFLNLLIGTIACFLAVSFILQTRDDFRFIIPYVEFRRDAKGSRPILLDTSVLIDGRIVELACAGFFDAQLIVPQFVVQELQDVADHPDRLKRTRGRRGLDVLAELKRDSCLDVRIYDADPHHRKDQDVPVDQRLLNLARELDGRAMTVDYNLNKVAQLSGVSVLNLNEIAGALKPEVLPGETMRVEIVRPGSGQGQGVGYLDDGTMVVVEQGRGHLHDEVDLVVTNTTQTAAGRMIFGRASDDEEPANSGGQAASRRRRPPPSAKPPDGGGLPRQDAPPDVGPAGAA